MFCRYVLQTYVVHTTVCKFCRVACEILTGTAFCGVRWNVPVSREGAGGRGCGLPKEAPGGTRARNREMLSYGTIKIMSDPL